MPLSCFEFLERMVHIPALGGTVLLTLGVVLVNGWTDAPNAIAGAVVTGALPFRRAAALAALCNFLGVLCVTSVNASVAETIYSIAAFDAKPQAALAALCAAMAAIVLWGTAAWRFGIPTSESHALVAGVSGAAVALAGDFSCLRWENWCKVLLGLILSVAAGFWSGALARRGLGGLRASSRFFRLGQIPGAAILAFLHGAQDGQKFLGIFLLGTALAQGRADQQTFPLPLWLLGLCAGFMALGTLMGGRRIIDTVGREMTAPGPREGLAADLACGACLLGATLLGLPVSTTHVRTAALLGVCRAGGNRVARGVAQRIFWAWCFTFPGCAAIGYWMAKVFLPLFS